MNSLKRITIHILVNWLTKEKPVLKSQLWCYQCKPQVFRHFNWFKLCSHEKNAFKEIIFCGLIEWDSWFRSRMMFYTWNSRCLSANRRTALFYKQLRNWLIKKDYYIASAGWQLWWTPLTLFTFWMNTNHTARKREDRIISWFLQSCFSAVKDFAMAHSVCAKDLVRAILNYSCLKLQIVKPSYLYGKLFFFPLLWLGFFTKVSILKVKRSAKIGDVEAKVLRVSVLEAGNWCSQVRNYKKIGLF